MSEFSDRPLVAGSLIGTRSFRVDKLGRLTGVSHREVWRPGLNEAECRKGSGWNLGGSIGNGATFYYYGGPSGTVRVTAEPDLKDEKPHQVASLDCACGFYAYTDTASNPHHEEGNVLAVVEASGVATVGTRGFRAEKAEIVALIAPGRPNARSLWDSYSEWANDHTGICGLIFMVGLIAGIVGGSFAMTAHMFVLGIAAFVLGSGSSVATVVANLHGQQLSFQDRRVTGRDHLSAETFALVQRNYPSVPVFKSLRDALDRFPLSVQPDPTPDDEDFWTRSI